VAWPDRAAYGIVPGITEVHMSHGLTPDLGALRREIREYHDTFIDAHVNNRPDFFVQDLDDEYVNVSRGELLRQTKGEILEMFTDYLADTTFSEYRLLGEPTIGFSKDGSVAWSIFRLKVAGKRTTADGSKAPVDSTWGCLVLFRRRGDRWIRIAEASNRKPDEASGAVCPLERRNG
jgi:hypothetical protein